MKLRLTKAGRVVIFILIVAILGTGGFFGYRYFSENTPAFLESFDNDEKDASKDDEKHVSNNLVATETDTSDPTINLSLD